jgi:Transglutaminase-like superfamily
MMDVRSKDCSELPKPLPGVWLADFKGSPILFDVRGDRYLSITPLQGVIWKWLSSANCLEEEIEHLTVPNIHDETTKIRYVRDQLEVWQKLSLIGFSTNGEDSVIPRHIGGKLAASKAVASNSVCGRPRLTRLAQLVAAWRWSVRSRRTKGIAAILVELQSIDMTPSADPWKDLNSILKAYHVLRAFRSHEKDCLTCSLAFVYVARRMGIDSRLCFGVKPYPFEAHAWCEFEDTILNDKVEKIAEFTLIARF